jgi:hypothetical protein
MFDRFSMNVDADNIDATSCEQNLGTAANIQELLDFSAFAESSLPRRAFSRAMSPEFLKNAPFRVEAANDMACEPDYQLSFLSVNHRSAQPSAELRRRSRIVVA